MDADRVRSYLQVACAGLGFDIGEVWWMNNESGTSTVAAIREQTNGHESDSSGAGAFLDLMKTKTSRGDSPQQNDTKGKKKKTPKKRFLQLYTSKAYCNQRSKLVQPHDTNETDAKPKTYNNNGNWSAAAANNNNHAGSPSSPSSTPAATASKQLTLHRTTSSASLELDQEHVLSPRIVEAVTHSTQVVWANCQKTEGLLGRSDIKLQTAIGMPVGVDENGNVWVVVMFSPKNVESSSDAIDYLQYISRSAASTSIPCLLPVVGDVEPSRGREGGGGAGGTKMICQGNGDEMEFSNDSNSNSNSNSNNNSNNNDNNPASGGLHHSHSLVSIKSSKQPDHTRELGDGVTAKFVSFNLNDDDDGGKSSPGGNTPTRPDAGSSRRSFANDLRDAPKDSWGIPMLPGGGGGGGNDDPRHSSDAVDAAIADAFDEASYGVWSTVMGSAGGGTAHGAQPPAAAESPGARIRPIRERLEEFATAFLGMSVFDVADAWTVCSSGTADGEGDGGTTLRCLFGVAATATNPGINALREASYGASVRPGDGAVGKAYSSGYPVWSSVKDLIYDAGRRDALRRCKIETAFSVPIFCAGDVAPSCVLSCYSLLPAESVPFVLNFVQKAVRLLWSGLDRVVDPHESVGRELWKDVGPADLGEMAADVEMQKAFVGRKRPRGLSGAGAGGWGPSSRRGEEETRRIRCHRADANDEGNNNIINNSINNDSNINVVNINNVNGRIAAEATRLSLQEEQCAEAHGRERENSLVAQMEVLPGLAPAVVQQQPVATTMTTMTTATAPTTVPFLYDCSKSVPINAPPAQGLAPAPLLPNTVQDRSPNAQQFADASPSPQQFVFLDTTRDGHWAVQQAVQSVGNVLPWDGGGGGDPRGQHQNYMHQQQQPQNPPPPPPQPLHLRPPRRCQMSYVNYQPNGVVVRPHPPTPIVEAVARPPRLPAGAHTDDPATIRANLMEFNAMARIHAGGVPGDPPGVVVAGGTVASRDDVSGRANGALGGTNHAAPRPPPPPPPPMPNDHRPEMPEDGGGTDLDRMVVIPLSHADGSAMLTGGPPRSVLYCTADPNAASLRPMSITGARTMDTGLFALDDGKPCRIEGCGGLAVAKRPYCARHCGNRQCEREGCAKCAQGATRFCIAHGGGRRCTFPGCDKGARDKYFCAAHGGGKRCKKDGCNKSAVGGSNFCTGHGGGKRCQVPGCDKSAQSSTRFCVKHGGGKKCQHDGCEKVARGRTLYCAAHGGGVRCKLEGCNRVAIGKAQLCRAHGGGANSRFNAAAI